MLATSQHLGLPELRDQGQSPVLPLALSQPCVVRRELSCLHHPRSCSSHAGPYRDPSWADPRLQLIGEAELSLPGCLIFMLLILARLLWLAGDLGFVLNSCALSIV